MNNKGHVNSREIRMQGILDHYLKVRSSKRNLEATAIHLDEDSLSTFVEGNLTEQEAAPIVNHLTQCSYCRHISAELVKLSFAFADEPQAVINAETGTTKVSEVLNGVLSRIFGTNDSAVFAHHEDDEDKTKEEDETE